MKRFVLFSLLVFLFSLSLAACNEESTDSKQVKKEAKADEPANKESAKKAEDPKPQEKKEPKKMQNQGVTEFAGSHILIAYKGAMRARPDVTMSKEEAKKKADELAAQLKTNPEKFEELAKANSACPSGQRGGDLGTWRKGQMTPAFDAAVEKLEEGKISGVVETPFGYHIIRRNKVVPPVMFAGSHILLSYKGAMRAKSDVTRTKEEAKKFAEDLLAKVKANPAEFEKLAKENSACPSGQRGGSLGQWKKGQMVPEFDTAVEGLKDGEFSGVVETPFGFHIIRRDALK